MHFKKLYFSIITFVLIPVVLFLFLAAAEVIARIMEPRQSVSGDTLYTAHNSLGWILTEGRTTVANDEYTATYAINSLGMNDRAFDAHGDKSKLRIMALGDSHTFATGVAQDETWPNALEGMISGSGVEAVSVYNCSVSGYCLGQYLLQMRRLKGTLRPDMVLIGFSMATDLYDLIPPRLGGFVYFNNFDRVYFDLDENGKLIEVSSLDERTVLEPAGQTPKSPPSKKSLSLRIREKLNRFALYRRFKRSKLAVWIAMNFRPKGESLWPGLDTALKKELDADDRYRWRLAEAIITELGAEARKDRIKVVLVNIPYLAQVYDGVWNHSYGMQPDRYDRWIAGERLKAICKRVGIYYIDTTQALIEETRRRKGWLHFAKDAHPTAEGHRIIAETVLAGLKEEKLVK